MICFTCWTMEEFREESDPIEQVVQKVVCFSSQYGADQSQSYAAWNLVGESYNFPSYGDFTQAFVMVGIWRELSLNQAYKAWFL